MPRVAEVEARKLLGCGLRFACAKLKQQQLLQRSSTTNPISLNAAVRRPWKFRRRTASKLAGNGGSLIDTASTYGDAESVLGDVMAQAGLRDKLFIATKCEAPDAAEVKRSLAIADDETRPPSAAQCDPP